MNAHPFKTFATSITTLSVAAMFVFADPCFAQKGEGGRKERGQSDSGQSGRSSPQGQGQGQSGRKQSSSSNSVQGQSQSRQAFRQDGESRKPSARQPSTQTPTAEQPSQRSRNPQQTQQQPQTPQTFRRQGNQPTTADGLREANRAELERQRQQSFFRGRSDRDERDDREFNRDRSNVIQGRDNDLRQSVLGRDFNRARDGRDLNRSDWSQIGGRIRSDWNHRDRDNLPFRFGWWNNYPRDRWPVYGPWGYTRWRDRPDYWWGWTPANQLTTWLTFGWDRPRYWVYGQGGNIYYQDNYVYYDGDRYLPVNEYYQQIYNQAHSVPQISADVAESMEWQPLGVFAVARDESEAQRTIQIAVNKNGVLAGTYYNAQNGHVHPITGMVDDRTQRAAWAFADGEHPKVVFESSIFNLTKPECTIMVHFGPEADATETWHLVRLEQPDGANSPAPAPRTATRYELP